MADDPIEVDIILPALGADAARVTVWFANPGDRVFAGERVVEVATESATFDVAAPAGGVLQSRLVKPRDPIAPGQTLGRILADRDD